MKTITVVVLLGVAAFLYQGYNSNIRKDSLESNNTFNDKTRKTNAETNCKAKLEEIKQSCASAGNIFDCIAIRGEPHGIRYAEYLNFSGTPSVNHFACH